MSALMLGVDHGYCHDVNVHTPATLQTSWQMRSKRVTTSEMGITNGIDIFESSSGEVVAFQICL